MKDQEQNNQNNNQDNRPINVIDAELFGQLNIVRTRYQNMTPKQIIEEAVALTKDGIKEPKNKKQRKQ